MWKFWGDQSALVMVRNQGKTWLEADVCSSVGGTLADARDKFSTIKSTL